MEICRLAVLIAILFDVSLMQEEACFCSLCVSLCEGGRRVVDALSTSSSRRSFSCPRESGMPTVSWSVENVQPLSSMSITPDNQRIIQTGFDLTVENVNRSFEGQYFCTVEPETGQPIGPTDRGCLIVRGRAYYESCLNNLSTLEGCTMTESIPIQAQGNHTLDLRLTYRDGGVCRNQTIRRLNVTKDGAQVYHCPNVVSTEAEPCNSTSKFSVTTSQCDSNMCSGCRASDQVEQALCQLQCCKFRLFLTIMDFNSSDPGLYVATYIVEEDGGIRRNLRKTFNLSIIISEVPTTASTSSDGGPSGTGGTMSPRQEGLGAGAAVGITIVAIFVTLLIIALVVVIVLCFIRKKGLYWMTKKPGQELKTNGPERAYMNNMAIDEEKRGQFNGNSIVSGRTNLSIQSRKEKGSSVVGSELPFELPHELFSESQRV